MMGMEGWRVGGGVRTQEGHGLEKGNVEPAKTPVILRFWQYIWDFTVYIIYCGKGCLTGCHDNLHNIDLSRKPSI